MSKSSLRAIYMAALLINCFTGLMLFSAMGSGMPVPGHLPWLIVSSGALCYYGWHINREDG